MASNAVSYYNNISLMMFGFGDSHKPNPETVRLVESITLDQLRLIIQEATKYQRNPSLLEGEDLVFLMRRNKYKMRRFIKYLDNQELKNKVESKVHDLKIPKNTLIEFIESIDETGELTDLTEYDEVKYERIVRADRISIALDEAKYLDFFKARCTSFKRQKCNLDKLRNWIDPKQKTNFSQVALDVLSYYAYETVAQITDMALLVRLDHNRTSDPLSNLKGMHFSAPMFNADYRFLKGSSDKPDYSIVCNGQPPISVNEIKEVMRRIYMPQAGKLNFGKKLAECHQILAI